MDEWDAGTYTVGYTYIYTYTSMSIHRFTVRYSLNYIFQKEKKKRSEAGTR